MFLASFALVASTVVEEVEGRFADLASLEVEGEGEFVEFKEVEVGIRLCCCWRRYAQKAPSVLQTSIISMVASITDHIRAQGQKRF